MKSNLLNWDETLFRDPDVFDVSYVPEQFDYRDTQTEALAFAVKPALHGGRIMSTVCQGPPATGKTTSVKKIFELLHGVTDSIVTIHVNCKIDTTEFAVFSRIYTSLTRQSIASGTSLKRILDQLAQVIVSKKVKLLICLDDANYLVYQNEFTNVLYPILRIHEVYPDVDVGVIVVVSDPQIDVRDTLDVRTRSSFHPEFIMYPPYTAAEMAGILNLRVIAGLYPNVFPVDLLDRVVEVCMEFGDVRMGLELIKRAVLLAERAGRKKVIDEDLDAVLQSLMSYHLLETVKSLTPAEFLVLKTAVSLVMNQDSVTTQDIQDALPADGPKKTRLSEIYLMLEDMKLLGFTYVNQGGGRRRLVSLKQDGPSLLRCIHECEANEEMKAENAVFSKAGQPKTKQ